MPPKIPTDLQQADLKRLLLDAGNPRLSLDQREAELDQGDLMRIMFSEFTLEELGTSFLDNGFFRHEPIVVMKGQGSTFVVLEGNRRVAALNLVTQGPATWGISSAAFDSMHKAFKALPKPKQTELLEPWIAIVPNRIAIAGYIGFRHVTGIKQWPALEKAAYIAGLVDEGMATPAIARVIGSKPAYVSRHLQAYNMIIQARNEEIVDTSALEHSFGVFMRALQASGVREFLRIPSPDNHQVDKKPLKSSSKKLFAEFVTWAFGTEDQLPLFSDSRQLTAFGKVLQSEKAVAYLRSMPNPDFDKAFFLSGGEEEEAASALQVAEFALRDSLPYARHLRENNAFSTTLRRCTDYLSQMLVYYPQLRSEFFAGGPV